MMTMLIVIVLTVLTTVPIIACITSFFMYLVFVRPVVKQRNMAWLQLQEIQIRLADEYTARTDLLKWVEVECRSANAPKVEKALKQRFGERLEALRQLRLQRQQMYQLKP